jgi:dihydrolipoamide dehydrogenase
VRVGTFNFGVLGRARIANETDGLVKIVAEKKYDEILGIHMIGPRSTELVAEATLALRMEITVEELIRTIHAHPTMSEAVGEAAHAVHGVPPSLHFWLLTIVSGPFWLLDSCFC